MHLEICGLNVNLSEAARAGVERRMTSALGRFMGRVARVRVILAAFRGSRGGVGKRCQTVIDLARAGRVVVEHRAAHWADAVGGAAGKMKQVIRRRLDRRGQRGRPGDRAGVSAFAEQVSRKEVEDVVSNL